MRQVTKLVLTFCIKVITLFDEQQRCMMEGMPCSMFDMSSSWMPSGLGAIDGIMRNEMQFARYACTISLRRFKKYCCDGFLDRISF